MFEQGGAHLVAHIIIGERGDTQGDDVDGVGRDGVNTPVAQLILAGHLAYQLLVDGETDVKRKQAQLVGSGIVERTGIAHQPIDLGLEIPQLHRLEEVEHLLGSSVGQGKQKIRHRLDDPLEVEIPLRHPLRSRSPRSGEKPDWACAAGRARAPAPGQSGSQRRHPGTRSTTTCDRGGHRPLTPGRPGGAPPR